MILPFLQVVVPEVKRLARAIAVHDPQKRNVDFWRVRIEDTWDYGLRVSGERRPDGIIRGPRAAELLAADVEYPGPPAELVELLVVAGLLEVKPAYLRVKGIADRYGEAWDKKKRNVNNGRKGAKARWEHPVANGQATGPADGKKEKEKEKETKKDEPVLRTGTRRPSFEQAAQAHFDRQRGARLVELGLPSTPDEQHHPAWVNSKLKPVLERLGGEEHPDIEARWGDVVSLYLDVERTAEASPPYPLRILAAAKTYEPLVERVLAGGVQ